MGATVGSIRVDRTAAWSTADLTGYVAQLASASTGTMSLALTQDNVTTDAVIILTSARESNRVPYLDITLAPTSAPANMPAPLLGSVSFTNPPGSVAVGSTTTLSSAVKNSVGGAFSGATLAYSSSN
ncbi:hypothetical protein, partial [Streptomyces roseofulvus]